MPLFECSKCHCVENTACCNYWWNVHCEKQPQLCSECDPEIGKWHGRFDKRPAAGMLIDQEGHLWNQEEVNTGRVPKHYRIVGKVEA